MSSQPTQHDGAPRADRSETWREIDQVVAELAALSESAADPAAFHARMLDRVVSTLAAEGGAVWTQEAGGKPEVAYQINMEKAGDLKDANACAQHQQVVLAAMDAKKPLLVPPKSGTPGAPGPSNPSDLLLVLCAWDADEAARGVVEIFQRPGTSPAAQRGYARFLEVVCQIAGDFHRNLQLAELHRLKEKWSRFERFSESVHRSLDLKETAFHVANEARHYLECDRVWVAVGKGRRCRVVAVSGVDTVNRRANVVRALERLGRRVTAAGTPLYYSGTEEELPPEIEQPLRAYIDTAHVRSVVVLPLTAPPADKEKRQESLLGTLIVERFFTDADDRFQSEIHAVSGHSQLALANAMTLRQLPFSRLLQTLGRMRWLFQSHRLPLTLLAMFLAVCAVVALVIVPADFEILTRGELQPLVRRHVFAPEDGVVTELQAEHGQEVGAGDVLMVLSKPELDVEFSRVWGELQTARQQLATVEAERLRNPRETQQQRQRHSQLTAEEGELREQIVSLQRQKEKVEQRQARLEIRSPIAGRVVSWNVEKRLRARPVARGQELLTVADLNGPWGLELRVPDKRMLHVLGAQRKIRPELAVTFILAMDPRRSHEGKIQQIGIRTEVSELEEPFVPVQVGIADQEDLPALVPGATARARIDCGRRALGYVWLHDLFEAFQTWVAF